MKIILAKSAGFCFVKEVWGYAAGVEAGTLRVFMATLRRKIEKEPSQPQHIITEVGVGYRFK